MLIERKGLCSLNGVGHHKLGGAAADTAIAIRCKGGPSEEDPLRSQLSCVDLEGIFGALTVGGDEREPVGGVLAPYVAVDL
jgi:hypothetical protein